MVRTTLVLGERRRTGWRQRLVLLVLLSSVHNTPLAIGLEHNNKHEDGTMDQSYDRFTSPVWPAPQHIEYDDTHTTTKNNSYPRPPSLLRTLHASCCQFEYTVEALSYRAEYILEAGLQRFQDHLSATPPPNVSDEARRWKEKRGADSVVDSGDERRAPTARIAGVRFHFGKDDSRSVSRTDASDAQLVLGVDESYEIRIPAVRHDSHRNDTTPIHDEYDNDEAWIQVKAQTVYGALYALSTLQQLVRYQGWRDAHDGAPVWTLPPHTPLDEDQAIENKDDDTSHRTHRVTSAAVLHIVDRPMYLHRGVLIDTARHFLPLPLIHSHLTAMAAAKLNVLHWHLSDTQACSLASVTTTTATRWCPHCAYTHAELHAVVEAATLRGIRIVPEVDAPGHVTALVAGRPELLTPVTVIEQQQKGAGAGTGSSAATDKNDTAATTTVRRMEPLDVTHADVPTLLEDIYAELASLFPDALYHVGGDEVAHQVWADSVTVRAWITAHRVRTTKMKQNGNNDTIETIDTDDVEDTKALLLHFTSFLLQLADRYGKRPIVWEELYDLSVLTAKARASLPTAETPSFFNTTFAPWQQQRTPLLPQSTIVQVWKERTWKRMTRLATEQGYHVIVSGCWYLDYLHQDWWDFYQCNPRSFTVTMGTEYDDSEDDAPLSPEQQRQQAQQQQLQYNRVLGGEACMWGELVDATNFFQTVWPRTLATAEILWSGGIRVDPRDGGRARRRLEYRLAAMRCWMVRQLRIPASPVAPGHCPGMEDWGTTHSFDAESSDETFTSTKEIVQ